jgi:DNA-binding response OmpR family regulator
VVAFRYMNKTVLVIEDEQDIRESVAEALTDAGFEVSTAPDGMSGLAKALEEHPELILLDLVMPGYDGHTVLEKLRMDSWGKTAKVVVLSSMDDVGNIASAHGSNITDYLIKAHSSLEDIVAKVRKNMYTG